MTNIKKTRNIELEDLSNSRWVKVYQSEHRSGSNIDFKAFKMGGSKLCNGDFSLPIKVELMKYQSNGSHKFKAETYIKVDEMKNGNTWSFSKNMGTLRLTQYNKEMNYDMFDYLRGGLQINLICCIDFTGSNGIPRDTSSLHYMDPRGDSMNQYQSAIYHVGEILLEYDSDKLVPVYGFGARPNPQAPVSHFFPLSFDPNNTSGFGIEGVFEIYQRALPQISLAGPTFFAPMMENLVNFTKTKEKEGEYVVLLLLTDGAIHDMQATIDQIVEGSSLPLSIIIVGVGKEDFANMEILDADDNPLISSSGKHEERDIVQFVPFRNFRHNPKELAAEVLAELPYQVTSYYRKKGIKPRPPLRPSNTLVSKNII